MTYNGYRRRASYDEIGRNPFEEDDMGEIDLNFYSRQFLLQICRKLFWQF